MSHAYYEDIAQANLPDNSRRNFYTCGGKRGFDILSVLLISPIVLPVIFCAWAITFLSGGTGFYRQTRVGKGGKTFQCWKIRTMAPNADQKLAATLTADINAALEWRRTQKLSDDPRITRFGRLLRETSIDEFPQFWNILKGDMSLIGPRPFTPNQRAMYDADSVKRAYYNLRPGLSGLWQVSSRNAGEFCDRVKFDDEYAENISFLYDLKIVFRTVWVVLKATGK